MKHISSLQQLPCVLFVAANVMTLPQQLKNISGERWTEFFLSTPRRLLYHLVVRAPAALPQYPTYQESVLSVG
jgi:hypothetical protein